MPFYSNAHIDFVDYAKMRILIFVMKKSIYIAIALFFSTLAAFSQKDPLVGFYMGKISNQTSYPFGQSPELCLEVSRFGESYQLKLTARPLLRTDNYGSASGLKAENGKIVLKNFSSLGLSGEITPEGALLKGKNRKGNETVADLKKTTIVSPTMGMSAPEGAIVLFDGKSKSEWQHIGGEPCSWKLGRRRDGIAAAYGRRQKERRHNIHKKEIWRGENTPRIQNPRGICSWRSPRKFGRPFRAVRSSNYRLFRRRRQLVAVRRNLQNTRA